MRIPNSIQTQRDRRKREQDKQDQPPIEPREKHEDGHPRGLKQEAANHWQSQFGQGNAERRHGQGAKRDEMPAVTAKIERKGALQEKRQKTQHANERHIEIANLPLRQLSALDNVMTQQPAQSCQETDVDEGKGTRNEQFAPGPPRNDQVLPDNSADALKPGALRQRK